MPPLLQAKQRVMVSLAASSADGQAAGIKKPPCGGWGFFAAGRLSYREDTYFKPALKSRQIDFIGAGEGMYPLAPETACKRGFSGWGDAPPYNLTKAILPDSCKEAVKRVF